jgi:AraC-like DNA-binding protein
VDVALASGFADQAHFSRMFKRAVGVSPARYRALGNP